MKYLIFICLSLCAMVYADETSTNKPLKIILIGSESEVVTRIRELSKITCLLQGARSVEEWGLSPRNEKWFDYDKDGNGLMGDRYGWMFDHAVKINDQTTIRANGPASSLVKELNLAGEFLFFNHVASAPTSCGVIFTIYLESDAAVAPAVKYLSVAGVLEDYVGPVEIHYGHAKDLRKEILRMLSNFKDPRSITTLSFVAM